MRTDRRGHAGSRSGFTIVELLVVIAIITVLMGLLLGGLRAARGTAKQSQQLSNLRQLYLGWQVYGNQNDDSCMPGFLEPEVQSAWKVKYRNASGTAIDPQLAQTYPWRLGGFLDYNTELVLGYLDRPGQEFASSVFEEHMVPATLPPSVSAALALPGSSAAFQPEFGYNAFYLGGWWEMNNGTPRTRFSNAKHPTTGVNVLPIARTIPQVTRPDNMVAFCSSIYANPGVLKEVDEIVPGAAWVEPPYLAQTQIWTIGDGGDSNSIAVLASGAVPLKRFQSVVYSSVDGSQRTASYKELWDMSLWTNRSDLVDAQRLQPVHTEN